MLMALLAGCGSDGNSCRCRGAVEGVSVDLACGKSICIAGAGWWCAKPNELVVDDQACLAESPDLAGALPDLGSACVPKSCGELGAACGNVVDNCGDNRSCGTCGAGTVCSAAYQCVPHCGDGAKNGDESDVDCGGATCGKCALEKICGATADCAAGSCNGGTCRTGSYTKLAPMPTARTDPGVATAPNGKIYVASAGCRPSGGRPDGPRWKSYPPGGELLGRRCPSNGQNRRAHFWGGSFGPRRKSFYPVFSGFPGGGSPGKQSFNS